MKTIEPDILFQIISSSILFLTLIAVFYQIRYQNKILKAQLNRDRFEMYWKTYEPITEDMIKDFEAFPKDYINERIYKKKYTKDKSKIRKYLMASKLYEYLAFSYNLKKLKLHDTLGYFWTEKWIKDLIEEDEFLDVHRYYKGYYPELAKFIDDQRRLPYERT